MWWPDRFGFRGTFCQPANSCIMIINFVEERQQDPELSSILIYQEMNVEIMSSNFLFYYIKFTFFFLWLTSSCFHLSQLYSFDFNITMNWVLFHNQLHHPMRHSITFNQSYYVNPANIIRYCPMTDAIHARKSFLIH